MTDKRLRFPNLAARRASREKLKFILWKRLKSETLSKKNCIIDKRVSHATFHLTAHSPSFMIMNEVLKSQGFESVVVVAIQFSQTRWWWIGTGAARQKKNFNIRAGADTGRRGSEIRTWNHISHFLLEFVTHKHSTLYSLLFCIIYTEWYTISPFTTDNNTTH